MPCLPFYNNGLGPCAFNLSFSCLLNNINSTNIPLFSASSAFLFLLNHFHQHLYILPSQNISVVLTFSFRYYIISLLSSKSPVTSTLLNLKTNFYSSFYILAGFDTFDHRFLLELFLLLVSGKHTLALFLHHWLLGLSLFDGSSSCQIINVGMSQSLVLGPFFYLPLLWWPEPASFKCYLYANESLIYVSSPIQNPRHIPNVHFDLKVSWSFPKTKLYLPPK